MLNKWIQNEPGGAGGWCYKTGSVSDIAVRLMRQFRFSVPGNDPAMQLAAVSAYISCTLSKPAGTYISQSSDCQGMYDLQK